MDQCISSRIGKGTTAYLLNNLNTAAAGEQEASKLNDTIDLVIPPLSHQNQQLAKKALDDS